MTSTWSAVQGKKKNQHQGKSSDKKKIQQNKVKACTQAIMTTLPLQVVEETEEFACWEEKDPSGRLISVKSSSKFTSALSSERVTKAMQKIKKIYKILKFLASMLFFKNALIVFKDVQYLKTDSSF